MHLRPRIGRIYNGGLNDKHLRLSPQKILILMISVLW